ncbi:hypothetical protein CTAYLR_000379 [Chrysophaeum taylorii]|uniref:Glycosyltransferase 61 catalytic domain-containing protein n=1 Tax=Chrysophaeum taylorii TaxID=2483200 RepID=A0AAD7UGL1_9STRA|nr:hypothetical protein CTAYLR_000379 [Chrysophaeum taylorii]
MARSCVQPRCGSGGCLPRFSKAAAAAAASAGAVRPGVAWVIGVRRARRISTTDWANMEHFAAAALPAFEALYKRGIVVDYVVLPQVPSLRGLRRARGADTDWFESLCVAMGRALGRQEVRIVARDELRACFEQVVHASYVPRATYLKSERARGALTRAASSSAEFPRRRVTLLLRSLGGGAARRAGPCWPNAPSLRRELEAWLRSNHPRWSLEVVALGHAFSFQSQIALAERTGVFVGAHGAALVNALFAPPGAALVEVLNCGHRSNTYRMLATNRGLSYFAAPRGGWFRGDDCSRDLGRKHVDTRRALPLADVSGPLDAAIRAVDPRAVDDDVACAASEEKEESTTSVALDAIAAAAEIGPCAAQRAASLVSVHVATLEASDETEPAALHAQRRRILAKTSAFVVREAFANLLIEAQRRAKHVLFLHVSKAAGTSFAKVAKANGCRAPSRFSTLWAPGDGPTWGNCARGLVAVHESSDLLGKGRRRNCCARELSCARRLKSFQDGKYDLMAIERWLDNAGLVCPDFWYVVLLRDPIARVVSHHNHLWRHTLRATQRIKQPKGGPYFVRLFRETNATSDVCVDLEQMPYALGAPHRTGYDWSMVCAFSSNFAARSLLGTAFSPRPYDSRSEPKRSPSSLLDSAKQILAKFALVLVVERAPEAVNLVRHVLGWKPFRANDILPRIGRDAAGTRKIVKQPLRDLDARLLRTHNIIDIDLYAYANHLFDLDLEFYSTASLFREPILDGDRAFCDSRRNANRSQNDDDDDDDAAANHRAPPPPRWDEEDDHPPDAAADDEDQPPPPPPPPPGTAGRR